MTYIEHVTNPNYRFGFNTNWTISQPTKYFKKICMLQNTILMSISSIVLTDTSRCQRLAHTSCHLIVTFTWLSSQISGRVRDNRNEGWATCLRSTVIFLPKCCLYNLQDVHLSVLQHILSVGSSKNAGRCHQPNHIISDFFCHNTNPTLNHNNVIGQSITNQ